MAKDLCWTEMTQLAKDSLKGDKDSYQSFLTKASLYLTPKIKRTVSQEFQEDVRQEILLAIHQSLNTIDPQRPLQKWIHAIAHYKVSDHLRTKYKTPSFSDWDDSRITSTPESNSVDLQQYLEHTLKIVNARERQVLFLLKCEGFSVTEVAEELNLSPQNIKTICSRALKKIRQSHLKEEFYAG